MATNCPIEVSPYDQSGIVKNPNIFNLNYTNQDFYSMKTRLVDFINERFGPDGTVIPNTFNDFVESDLAIMLIENWAFLADTLSFKMDQIVNELFIDTVTEVENAFRLSKLVGFKPQPPIAARSLWSATINNPILTDITIETPLIVDVVSGGDSITIELFQADSNNIPKFEQDILLPAGSIVNQSIVGLEGRTYESLFTGTGEPAQNIELGFFPVIDGSIKIEVDGFTWTKVDFFTDSNPRREYRVEFDSEYHAYAIFGNNRAGLIPSQGSQIQATFRVGGGTAGNIITGFVEKQSQIVVPGLSFNVPVTFRNYTKGEFGYNGDGIEDIRRKLPLWLSTQNRAVSGEDYKILADQFTTLYHGQIGKSTAILRNHGCAANIIDLYVLAKDGDDDLEEAGNELKVDLNDELNIKKMLTDFVCIRNGEVIYVDVSIDVNMDKFYRKFEPEYTINIQRKVNEFFSLNNWDYGKTLRDTDIIKELSDIKEVNGYDITFVTDDADNSGNIVSTKFFEIIRPDDIVISFVFE